MRQSASALIAMGSNLPFGGVFGPALLAQAASALRQAGLAARAHSGVWRTAAWPDGLAQPDYYNAALDLDARETTPQQLYLTLRTVERSFGRERSGERWAARTLDLDIVAMGALAGEFGDVVLPHPRMHERGFVLSPLAEIAPDWRHPVLARSVAELLRDIPPAARGERVGDLAM